MYTIDKEFHFEYGHRVWSQELDQGYCAKGDNKCACRHLHGHSGKVTVYANAIQLQNGMVTDFKHLGWIKDFLDTYLDHKFIIDVNDPQFILITNRKPYTDDMTPIQVTQDGRVYGWTFDLEGYNDTREFYESFIMVDFLPTSENFTRWLCDLANERMNKISVNISRIDWSETSKSRASYSK